MFSCTNLDDVNKRLDNHEERLKGLESLVSNTNKSIENLQKLINAQEKKLSIVSYLPKEDGTGYVLTMSDGTTMTLNNGMNGKSPLVSVKEVDGDLCWTINGELIHDAHGKPIKAEGHDGESGVTPKIRVNIDKFWEVSMDGGVNWQLVEDADGQPVKAVGSDANVDLKITEDANAITIIYDGHTFVIPKNGTGEDPIPAPEHPKMAIEYVAEHNVGLAKGIYAGSDKNNASGLYTWAQAKAACPAGSHLPSAEEWRGIVADYPNVDFTSTISYNDVSERIEVNGDTKTYFSDYRNGGDGISYALRFKDDDNKMLAAYRYQVVGTLTSNNLDSHLKVTVRYLGPDFSGDVDEIAKESYWSSNDNADVIRIFPACGMKSKTGLVSYNGAMGFYWSSTEFEGDRAVYMDFMDSSLDVSSHNGKGYGFAVRPFIKE